MDRLELRTKFSSRVDKIRLEDYDLDVFIRRLTALERAQFAEACRVTNKNREDDNMLEIVTVKVSAYVVAHGLCDEKGNRFYKDDELQKVAEEFPADALDAIAELIVVLSKLKQPLTDEIKNLNPTPNESSKSPLPQSTEGGTSTDS